MEDNR